MNKYNRIIIVQILIITLIVISVVLIRIKGNWENLQIRTLVTLFLLFLAFVLFKINKKYLYKNVKNLDENELKNYGIRFEFNLLTKNLIRLTNGNYKLIFTINYNNKKYTLYSDKVYDEKYISQCLKDKKVIIYVNHLNFSNYLILI